MISDNKSTAQKEGAKKRPQTWKKGQSGNPKGAPKRGTSFKEIYEWALECDRDDMIAVLEAGGRNDLSNMFRLMPKGVHMKALLAARIVAANMFEPQPGLVNHIADRIEGKVAQPITSMSDDDIRKFISTTIGIDVSSYPGSAAEGDTAQSEKGSEE